MKLSKIQLKLLRGLREHGYGRFDNYYRIVAGGELLTHSNSLTALSCFKHNLIEVRDRRIYLTERGEEALGA